MASLCAEQSPVKLLALWILTLIAILLAWTALDWRRANSLTRRAQEISAGDSKQHVNKLLGEPTATFLPPSAGETNFLVVLLGVRRETWAYGRSFDLHNSLQREFPYFNPVVFRFFGPDTEDIKVEFDGSGKVVKVSIPGN